MIQFIYPEMINASDNHQIIEVQLDQDFPRTQQYQLEVDYYNYDHFYDRLSLMDPYSTFTTAHFSFQEPPSILQKQSAEEHDRITFFQIVEKLVYIFPNIERLGFTFKRPISEFGVHIENQFCDINFQKMPDYFNEFKFLQVLDIWVEDQQQIHHYGGFHYDFECFHDDADSEKKWKNKMKAKTSITTYKRIAKIIPKASQKIKYSIRKLFQRTTSNKVSSKFQFVTLQQRRKYQTRIRMSELLDNFRKIEEWRSTHLKVQDINSIFDPLSIIREINFPLLQEINLQDCSIVTVEEITRLKAPTLKQLNLSQNRIMSGKAFIKLLSLSIIKLDFKGNLIKQLAFEHVNQINILRKPLFDSFGIESYCRNITQIGRLKSRKAILRVNPEKPQQVDPLNTKQMCGHWRGKIVYVR